METTTGSRADRPFFRFSLRGLAALVAVVGAAFAVWAPRLEERYQARQMAEANERLLASAADSDLESVSEAIAAGADLKARASPGGRTALSYAVDRGDLQLLERLLQAGAPPDATFLQGYDSLTALEVAIRQGKADIASRLLELDADPNGPTVRNGIPLLLCVALGEIEMAEMLLDFGADVNGWNESGRYLDLPGQAGRLQLSARKTPLYVAVTVNHPHAVRVRMVRLLLERGADPTIPDDRGATVVGEAERSAELRTLLQEHGFPADE